MNSEVADIIRSKQSRIAEKVVPEHMTRIMFPAAEQILLSRHQVIAATSYFVDAGRNDQTQTSSPATHVPSRQEMSRVIVIRHCTFLPGSTVMCAPIECSVG